MINESLSSIELCDSYPTDFPFSPEQIYPEYPFKDFSSSPNPVYQAVRNHLKNLKLDKNNFDTVRWNPLGEFNLIGKKIVIKPNWVKHFHPSGEDVWCIITHPSFIRVIIDYIYIATQGRCQVTIGDSPIRSTDFGKVIQVSKINELQKYFSTKGLSFKIEDFRLERGISNKNNRVIKIVKMPADSEMYVRMALDESSWHCEIDSSYDNYRVTKYNRKLMSDYHQMGKHSYLIARTVMESDFLINLPKMKTHRKAGVTLSLKNLIGTCSSKDCLPHHRRGAKSDSSDEYRKPDFIQWIGVCFREWGDMFQTFWLQKPLRFIAGLLIRADQKIRTNLGQEFYTEGSWYGNDTIWRTCLDLNIILRHGQADGVVNGKHTPRKYLSIIDGVLGGEKEAPLQPTPIKSEITVAGFNPVVCDYVATRTMGLSPEKIPIIRNSFLPSKLPLCAFDPEQIEVFSSTPNLAGKATTIGAVQPFEPSSGWKGHIEC
jgi:uncharacterized protein (DUF362 family)